jgi:proline dehydrogenase
MSGSGRPAVATTDRRLVAIAGERAAWFDRSADHWEHVMPLGVRTDEQRRLVAAGYRVRVSVPWGPVAPAAVLRQLGGRS